MLKNAKKASIISDSFQFPRRCDCIQSLDVQFFLDCICDFCAFVYKYEVHKYQKGKCSIVPAMNLAQNIPPV